MDFTIVIPHRGSAMGLWATVASCEDDLLRAGFNYKFVVVANGEEKLSLDTKTFLEQFGKSGRLQVIEHPEPISPPRARQLGADQAEGKYIFFFDNHCVVSRDYFKRAMLDFEKYDMDMLHSTTSYFPGDGLKHYHYKFKLEHNFWAGAADRPKIAHKPYQIGAGGHGGFAVKTDTWKELGGYGPANLFIGYGGEEIYTDLKFWMHNKSVWIDPYLLHYHYAGDRGYKRHYTDEYFMNMMACANVIGGKKWLYKVFESFNTPDKFGRHKSEKTMFDLLMEAELRSDPHAKELEASRVRSLDEQLVWLRSHDIPW